MLREAEAILTEMLEPADGPEPDWPTALPQHIGRFEIRGMLGAGASSQVFRALDRGTADWVALKVADAVSFVHARGVLHRDLKPSNVLVTADGEPVVLDFGASRAEGSKDVTGSSPFVGTVSYMSSQQIAGHACSERSDQFALAAMLFEALTGVLPHSEGGGLAGWLEIAAWDGRQAEVVRLMDGEGLGREVVAERLGISQRAVSRDRQLGLAWLRRRHAAVPAHRCLKR